MFHSRHQRPRSFWLAQRIATSGQVQHRKSAIHGLPVTMRNPRVKSDRSDWFWSQAIVFTKPSKSLDLAREKPRGRDSWCWPKGAWIMGTRMYKFLFAWVTGDAIEVVLFFETERHKFPFHLLSFPVSSLLASSRRSVSQGAVQKKARSPPFFYFFARCFLHCALTNWTPGRGYQSFSSWKQLWEMQWQMVSAISFGWFGWLWKNPHHSMVIQTWKCLTNGFLPKTYHCLISNSNIWLSGVRKTQKSKNGIWPIAYEVRRFQLKRWWKKNRTVQIKLLLL